LDSKLVLATVLLFPWAGGATMPAEKRHRDNDPHDQTLIDDLTERVFKDYEPPKPEPSNQINENEDEDGDENQAAA
jgi:hypothetical protein